MLVNNTFFLFFKVLIQIMNFLYYILIFIEKNFVLISDFFNKVINENR